jgi:hypothetical protein
MDTSLLVADFEQHAVMNVDPLTGNRTTLSGCANDACSSIVGSGRTFVGPLSLMQNHSGELFVLDRASPFSPNPIAVVKVDTVTGNGTIVSGCIDASCTAIAGSAFPSRCQTWAPSMRAGP